MMFDARPESRSLQRHNPLPGASLPFLSRLLPTPGEELPWRDDKSSGPWRYGGVTLEPCYPMPINLQRPSSPVSPLTPLYQIPLRLGEHATPRRPEPVPLMHRPCAQCRSAKVKCDRLSRCSRCVKLGIVCKLPPSPQQRRPRAASGESKGGGDEERPQKQQKLDTTLERSASESEADELFKPLGADGTNELTVDLNYVFSPSPEQSAFVLDDASPPMLGLGY